MYMSHSIFPGVWMTHPLQILQTQILRSGLTQPGRRAPRAQSQSVSLGGATNGPTTVTPPAPAPTVAPAATESGKSKKAS